MLNLCYDPGSSLRKRNDLQGKDGLTSILRYLTNDLAWTDAEDNISRMRMGGSKGQPLMAAVAWARRIQVAMATDEAIRKAVDRKAYGYSLNDSNGT